MRVVFAGGGTGGHLYPGLAIARALVRLEERVHPFFVGAKRGIEREILPKVEFPHLLLDLQPLQRARPWRNWDALESLENASGELRREMRADRPGVVVGTGGYASAAALLWAAFARVPFVLQEQNSAPGLVTRAFSPFAREVYLGYAEAIPRLTIGRRGWIGETGNPILPPPAPRPLRDKARRRWGFPESGGRVLLVFGGSQGAQPLNEAMAAWVDSGVAQDLYIIWATGQASHLRYAEFERKRVRVVPYLSPIADAYAAADLALTRAGALTLAELCAWGLPSVLVPLPTAAADHQNANARALEGAGAALVLPQSELTAAKLAAWFSDLIATPQRLEAMAAAASRRARPDAAETIARRILTLLDLKQIDT